MIKKLDEFIDEAGDEVSGVVKGDIQKSESEKPFRSKREEEIFRSFFSPRRGCPMPEKDNDSLDEDGVSVAVREWMKEIDEAAIKQQDSLKQQ